MAGHPPYNNLTYYTFGTPNGLKPSIVLEELGLKYNAVNVDITKNTQKESWYLDINPNGRIPALKDGEMRIFESGAIMLYLADHYDTKNEISYDHGTTEYWEMVSWLMWQMGGLGPMQGQANHFRAMAPVYSEYGINRYIGETKRLLGVLESRLKDHDWLVGNKYTIADIASYTWAKGAGFVLEIDTSEFPGVEKWIERIGQRDGVKRGSKVPEGGVRSDEQMKEMFEKMRAKVDSLKGTEKDEERKKDEL